MSCGVGHRCGLDLAWLWLWLWAGSCSSDLTPRLGTSICCWCGPKKKKSRRTQNEEKASQLNAQITAHLKLVNCALIQFHKADVAEAVDTAEGRQNRECSRDTSRGKERH